MCNSILKKLGILSLVLVGAGIFSTQSYAAEPCPPAKVVATCGADTCAPQHGNRRERVENRRERHESRRERRETRRERHENRRERREDRRERR